MISPPSFFSIPFSTIPIDDRARDGRFQTVVDPSNRFALVRWDDGKWAFSSGVPLDFEPTHYRPSSGGGCDG